MLAAHGHTRKRVHGKLTAESRIAYRTADLHAPDLRREFASRLRQSGAPDHVVGAWLGHAHISTTSAYLKTNRTGLQAYLRRFERHRTDCKEVVNPPLHDVEESVSETDPKSLN